MRQKMVLLALLGLCVSSAAALGGDWPQWRGPNRDGVSLEKNLSTNWSQEGPPRVWTAQVGKGFSSIAVSGDRLYTMGNIMGRGQASVLCLDAASGKTLWHYDFACRDVQTGVVSPGPRATPTVDDNGVYAQSQQGDFLCLDKVSGKLLWSKDFKKEFDFQGLEYESSSSPLVMGDLVIVDACAPKANVVAMKKDSGAVVWTTLAGQVQGGNADPRNNQRAKMSLQRGSYSSPMAIQLAGKPAVLCFLFTGLAALNPADGKTLWTFDWNAGGDRNIQTPVLDGDKVFIGNGDPFDKGKGCAFLKMAAGGATSLWQNANLKNSWSTAVMWKGYLYGFCGKEYTDATALVCLDSASGAVKWQQKLKTSGSLICADGQLICLGFDGELSVLEAQPAGYKQLAKCQAFKMDPAQFKPATGIEAGNVISPDVCRTPPALANGRLYCRNAGGEVVCLDLRKKP